jgi:hypothetical protein
MNLVPSIQLLRREKLFDFEGKPIGGWRTNFQFHGLSYRLPSGRTCSPR